MLANTNIKVAFRIFFLVFSNTNFHFDIQKQLWRFYIIIEALYTICLVEVIHKRKFARVVLDKDFKRFVIHIVVLEAEL